MNDILKSKLEILAEDDLLLDALRAVFEERVEKERPQIGEEDNSLLGEKFRAYEVAQTMLELAFKDLKDYKKVFKKSNNFNKER